MKVTFPYDGSEIADVPEPTPDEVERAVAAADRVAEPLAALPAHARAEALRHVSERLAERAGELADLIVSENGKPLRWAKAEVARATSTFRFAAEEARRWSGELQRLDTDPNGAGRMAVVRRFPRGPVLAVTPFNFPLNLVAHKVAPALAVGAPVIVKPAPKTPLSALRLGEIVAETDLPDGSMAVLPVPNDRAGALVADERLPVVSFTGSGAVGWSLKEQVPRKQVVLELGGNAAAVICPDYAGREDLDWAATRIAMFSNYQAGQSCIAVQRVFADASVYEDFLPRLTDRVAAQVAGDPRDEKTEVGPLISTEAADRVEAWVAEAVRAGARVLTGGQRTGDATYAPTVLVDVPGDAKVSTEEVFGPVLAVWRTDGVEDAFARVNDSAYGLQAGVFTRDLRTAFAAHRALKVGGVVVGDAPSYRADQMPYGGTKASGQGREGLRSAMADLTEERVLVLTGLDL